MKSKPMFLGIFMLVLLLVYQIIPALSDIVESELKSLVVETRMRKRDIFTVNMKSGHTCAEAFSEVSAKVLGQVILGLVVVFTGTRRIRFSHLYKGVLSSGSQLWR